MLASAAAIVVPFGSLRSAEPTPAGAAVEAVTPGPVVRELTITARDLTRGLQKGLAAVAQARTAPASGGTPVSPRGAAYDAALAECVRAVDRLAAALGENGKDPHQALREAGVAIAALQVCHRYRGTESESLDISFRKVTAIYGILRRNFGRDLVAAQSESEAALDAAQRAGMDDLKGRGIALRKQLDAARADDASNPAIAFEFEAMRRGVERVDASARNRRAMLDALSAGEIVVGRWQGLRRYVERVYPADARVVADSEASLRAFEKALAAAAEAAYSGNASDAFAQPAHYVEDIAIREISDDEAGQKLQAIRAAAGEGDGKNFPQVSPEAATAAAAKDRQINADDPDDDTALDNLDEEEEAAREHPSTVETPR